MSPRAPVSPLRRLLKYCKRLLIALLVLLTVLALPIANNELMCRNSTKSVAYTPVLSDPEKQRDENRTYLTYPEWHIVHVYDDYAFTIGQGNPHDYNFLAPIKDYWVSLCSLSQRAEPGKAPLLDTKAMVYTIGVSFTLELLLKAFYEESIGRVFTLIRGDQLSALDESSAVQAAAYAKFLQQAPWYQWDFSADLDTIRTTSAGELRDSERSFALGVEFSAKAKYAALIGQAVASTGFDKLVLHTVVKDISSAELQQIEGIKIIAKEGLFVEIETPRYRAFTLIAKAIAQRGGNFVEIAGNDDIMLTALSGNKTEADSIMSYQRQGYADYRHLITQKVADLSDNLRRAEANNTLLIEHIHDY